MEWKRAGQTIKVPLLEYLEELLKQEKALGHTIAVSVGTDSQRNCKQKFKFATVILISVKEDLGGGVIVGRGGKMIYSEKTVEAYERFMVDGQKMFAPVVE